MLKRSIALLLTLAVILVGIPTVSFADELSDIIAYLDLAVAEAEYILANTVPTNDYISSGVYSKYWSVPQDYNTYQQIVSNAQLFSESPGTDIVLIIKKIEELEEATHTFTIIKRLWAPANKTVLTELINLQYKGNRDELKMDISLYTYDSWINYTNALNEAKFTEFDIYSTTAEVNFDIDRVNSTIDALELFVPVELEHMNFIEIVDDNTNAVFHDVTKAIKDTNGFSLSNQNTVAHLFDYITVKNAVDYAVLSSTRSDGGGPVVKAMGDILEKDDVLVITDKKNNLSYYTIKLSTAPIITTKSNFGSYIYAKDVDDNGRVNLNISFYVDAPVDAPFLGMSFEILKLDKTLVMSLPSASSLNLQTDEQGTKYIDFDYLTTVALPNGNYLFRQKLVNYPNVWLNDLKIEFGATNFEVVFVDFNNNVLSSQTVPIGGSAIAPNAPLKNGYTFIGWSNTYTNVTSSRTLVPIYQITDNPEFTNPDVIAEPVKQTVTVGVSVMINGKMIETGSETVLTEGGKSSVVFNLEKDSVNKQIDNALKTSTGNNQLAVPITNTGDSVKVNLSGESIKKLGDNDFKISVQEKSVEYRIDASEISVQTIADKLGLTGVDKLNVEIQINKLSSDEINSTIEMAKSKGHSVIFEPVEFKVVVTDLTEGSTNEEINVSKFNNYVERVMEIPSGVDPKTITTGVVINKDGTYSHIPTVVFELNGKWYAKLNSVTNSKYSVISSKIELTGLSGHWAEHTINNMGSRLVLTNVAGFKPDKAVTREEFADYLVRALGLLREGSADYIGEFSDITSSNKQSAISAAKEWGIVTGYANGTFRASNYLTREEAMVMYSRAMELVKFKETEATQLTSTFDDVDSISHWAREHVLRVCSAGIFNGQSSGMLSPKGNLTHAEALTAIENLLLASNLINK